MESSLVTYSDLISLKEYYLITYIQFVYNNNTFINIIIKHYLYEYNKVCSQKGKELFSWKLHIACKSCKYLITIQFEHFNIKSKLII